MRNKLEAKGIVNVFQEGSLKLLPNKKPILGVDIGSTSLKLAYMKKNYNLAKWAMEPIPSGIINQGRIEARAPLTEIIKKTLKNNKIKAKECALCISCNELIVREIKLPMMEEDQLADNIKHEFTGLLPMDASEYSIDYKIIEYIKSENEDGYYRILVAAVPKSIVNEYILTLKKAGLKVIYIDILQNIAGKLCKWMTLQNRLEKTNNTCFIDFGAKNTQIIIMKNNNYMIHKTISNGGEYINSIISYKLGLDAMAAEEYKMRTNFFGEEANDALGQQLREFFDYQLREFERTISFFGNRNNHERVERIYLIGGGSMLEGLAEYMQSNLFIEVHPISDVMEEYQSIGGIGKYISAFAQAIGVTMREEW